jgi:cytidine deaminase
LTEESINIQFKKFHAFSELPEAYQVLWNKALEARKHSYSPYSNFTVGCAIELDNGTYITGTNQENAAFPAGLCAERTAMYRAGIEATDNKFVRIAITASKAGEEILQSAPPCGGCRQVMVEFEKRHQQKFEILFTDASGDFIIMESANDLFPFSFVF